MDVKVNTSLPALFTEKYSDSQTGNYTMKNTRTSVTTSLSLDNATQTPIMKYSGDYCFYFINTVLCELSPLVHPPTLGEFSPPCNKKFLKERRISTIGSIIRGRRGKQFFWPPYQLNWCFKRLAFASQWRYNDLLLINLLLINILLINLLFKNCTLSFINVWQNFLFAGGPRF